MLCTGQNGTMWNRNRSSKKCTILSLIEAQCAKAEAPGVPAVCYEFCKDSYPGDYGIKFEALAKIIIIIQLWTLSFWGEGDKAGFQNGQH